VKKRYFIFLSYKGTAYHGWQIQPNGVSVQEVLEKALSTILRIKIPITGAGRTDTGVHARLMVAHFDVANPINDLNTFILKLNSLLPNDIAVSKIVEVQPEAHARFDAISRTYEYHVVLNKDVFRHDFAVRLYSVPDFNLMNKAAEILKEYTDFTSFSKLHTDVKTNNCKIMKAEWSWNENAAVFIIEADRFLRNMVRAITGTLLEVGKGKMTLEEFRKVIELKDRCKAGTSLPAKGLFLTQINYPPEVFIT
jgi:tRNA pseudouridine38-40 synthase